MDRERTKSLLKHHRNTLNVLVVVVGVIVSDYKSLHVRYIGFVMQLKLFFMSCRDKEDLIFY